MPRPAAVPWIVRLAACAALVGLVWEFGFPDAPHAAFLRGLELASAAAFAFVTLSGLAGATDRRRHLQARVLETGLLLLLAAAPGLGFAAVRLYLLGRLALLVAAAQERLVSLRVRPAVLFVGSFVALIAGGTGLLMLPSCHAPGRPAWSVLDALFTSTSAACVTGLVVRDVGADLTFRGQAVVLSLVQAGGLGIVVLAMVLTLLQRQALRLRHLTFVQESLGERGVGNLGRLMGAILAITAVLEAAGALALYAACPVDGLEGGGRAWWALFHSVSAFCNAGFSLGADSLVPFAGRPSVVLPVLGLLVLGGIGFPVLLDLLSVAATRGRRLSDVPRARLRLHSRMVLAMAGLLLLAGTAGFAAAEAGGVLEGLSPGERLLTSLFQSGTARTAGFNTVDVGALQTPTLLLIMLLMVVGASPVSTGGGIKTTTAAVVVLTLRSMLRNRDAVEVGARTLPRAIVNAAIAVLVLYGAVAFVILTALLFTQSGLSFGALAFETVSALSTVGLTTGATAQLNGAGRLILCAAMLVGRVGPLAIVWAVVSRPPSLRYQYPEEEVVVT